MKKFLLVVLGILFLQSLSQAQYRCIPHIDETGNPSESMTNDVYTSGVDLALGYEPTPVWSAVYPIGFPFLFNGDSVTHFKVSSTGVVTFDTTVTAVPPFGTVMLPNALMPDKSICVTGIKASNTNSKVVLRAEPLFNFYTGIKRKWIMFNYFSDTTSNLYANTVFWSVVLEEQTNKIYIIDAYTGVASTVQVSGGIQIDNTTAYMIPGSPNVPSLSGTNFYDNDNVYYEFSPGVDLPTDGAVTALPVYPYQEISNAPFTIPVKFRNLGTDTVQTVTLSYSVDGILQQSQLFSGLSLPCGNSQVFNFSLTWTPPASGFYDFILEASAINNNTDADTSNNRLYTNLSISSVLPPRRALFEQAKGTWCSHCGYWTVKYDSILALNRAKASDLKLEQGGYNLAWSQADVYARTGFYETFSYPSAYANGKLALSNVYSYWAGCPWHVDQNMIDSLYALKGLFYIQPTLTTNGYHGEITATITSAAEFLPNAHCNIQVALLQDTIITDQQGASGESLFVNTMLKMFPNAGGTFIGSPSMGQIDSVQFSFQVTDTSTILSRLRVVVFVQDTVTKEVFQVAEAPVVNNGCTPVFATTAHDICYGDSINIGGTWYYHGVQIPQLLTGSNGCDSLHVDYIVMHLGSVHIYTNGSTSIYPNSVSLYPQTDSITTYAWYDVTNSQFIPGANQSTLVFPPHPGMYALMITNQIGCQTWSNTVNFQCTPTTFQQSVTICNGDSIQVGNSWHTLQGTYVDHLFNATGCDSAITTTLTVIAPDTGLVINNSVFIANSGSVFYEWIDCISGNVLSSGINDTIFTATTTGWYQLQVTDSSGCTFASACYPVYFTGLTETADQGFMLLPNPADNYVQIILNQPVNEGIVEVYDAKGVMVASTPVNYPSLKMSTASLSNGIYFLTVSGNGFTGHFKKLVIAR